MAERKVLNKYFDPYFNHEMLEKRRAPKGFIFYESLKLYIFRFYFKKFIFLDFICFISW